MRNERRMHNFIGASVINPGQFCTQVCERHTHVHTIRIQTRIRTCACVFVLSGRGMLLTVSRPVRRGELSSIVDPEKCTVSRTQSTTSKECSSNNKVVVVGTSRSNRPINRPYAESATGLRPRTNAHLCTHTYKRMLQKARKCSLSILLCVCVAYILYLGTYNILLYARASHICVYVPASSSIVLHTHRCAIVDTRLPSCDWRARISGKRKICFTRGCGSYSDE